MKKLLFILLSLFFVACTYESGTPLKSTVKIAGTLEIIEIDSCEYIRYWDGYRGSVAHKGNCKYCTQRFRKELEEWKK